MCKFIKFSFLFGELAIKVSNSVNQIIANTIKISVHKADTLIALAFKVSAL